MTQEHTLFIDETLTVLRAAGEATRLRLLALLAESEITVKDATAILGQSQPGVSRHLKMLTDAGVVLRFPEGAWVFYRLADGSKGSLTRDIVNRIAAKDPVLLADKERLSELRRIKAAEASSFFARHAPGWDKERSLHVADQDVEAAMLKIIGDQPFHSFLDLGTGTGRLLELFADHYHQGLGIDVSHEMLAVARANLSRSRLGKAQVRHGDIYALNVSRHGYDVITLHQVLHFLDDPQRALSEAARALRPGGRLLIIDFAPHELEFLREAHAHRRLGFSHDHMERWLRNLDLDLEKVTDLEPQDNKNSHLTVTLWLARDRRIVTDFPVTTPNKEVA